MRHRIFKQLIGVTLVFDETFSKQWVEKHWFSSCALKMLRYRNTGLEINISRES